MKNLFLERSYKKCGGEPRPRPFHKKLKLSICLDQQSEMLYSFFNCISKSGSTRIY